MNRAFGASDTMIYIPLIIVSLIGLFSKKRWSLFQFPAARWDCICAESAAAWFLPRAWPRRQCVAAVARFAWLGRGRLEPHAAQSRRHASSLRPDRSLCRATLRHPYRPARIVLRQRASGWRVRLGTELDLTAAYLYRQRVNIALVFIFAILARVDLLAALPPVTATGTFPLTH